MLSNPTTLHQRQRQRQHRRQKSTPTAFETPKVPNLPNIQPHGFHRRGMSLDQRLRRQPPPQDFKPVSTTNHGLQQAQHILREAQQQRLARPGQMQPSPQFIRTDDENYLVSPLISPQSQYFDAGCSNQYGSSREQRSSYSPYTGRINTVNQIDLVSPGHSRSNSQDSILFTQDAIPSSYMGFSASLENFSETDGWATIKPLTRSSSSRRVSGGIASRVAMFEDMRRNELAKSRPATPSSQNAPDYFPPTPATTPFSREEKMAPALDRFQDSYDTSMEDTIRPSRSKSNQRTRTIFQEMRDHAELNRPLSPPATSAVSAARSFDSAPLPTSNFMNMSNLNLDFIQNDSSYESSQFSPQVSYHSSPVRSRASTFENAFEGKPNLDVPAGSAYTPESHSPGDADQGQSPGASSPPRHSMSADDFDLTETITETGITIDDIACYIEGPDPGDQKWTCLFSDCGKRFGRKENIKSHVQTHLGDRQYQCPHCRKCFVRQHDLKRHAKIHSGVKPYPCLCGNSFARHDALTRHRQRGMCIGAFEGVVKKVVKRGRPRKSRPNTEERLDKASRTKTKNKIMSSASSTSGYSESSYGNSPPGDFDILDDKQFEAFTNDFSQSSAFIDSSSFIYSSAASPEHTDYVSPQAIQNAPSPSAFSTHSQRSHHTYHSHRDSIDTIPEHHLPALPASPAKSTASYYNTPPELCLSSSSPPPSNQVYDISQPSTGDEMDLSKLDALQNADLQQYDDMFMDAFGVGGDINVTRLEQDPSLLLSAGKFDDTFVEWEGWT